MILGQSLTER